MLLSHVEDYIKLYLTKISERRKEEKEIKHEITF